VETLWLVNGERSGVDPADRGLAYGDGLFETMRAERGTVKRFDLHYERLREGCERLAIPTPNRALIEGEIAAHLPAQSRAIVKLIVTRGAGTRGYRPPPHPQPTRILAISPWVDYPAKHYAQGVRVRTCELRLGENPHLAGIKHLCRLEQVLAQLELRDGEVEQGLLLDASGRVIGGTSSNIFIVRGGNLETPAITRCGIRGVMRRAVIAAAAELALRVTETDLALRDVESANEVFVTNALFGIWPVAQLGERRLDVGPVTRRLMRHLEVGGDG
jgi:4-amino-4-deoxychorismate lyase